MIHQPYPYFIYRKCNFIIIVITVHLTRSGWFVCRYNVAAAVVVRLWQVAIIIGLTFYLARSHLIYHSITELLLLITKKIKQFLSYLHLYRLTKKPKQSDANSSSTFINNSMKFFQNNSDSRWRGVTGYVPRFKCW